MRVYLTPEAGNPAAPGYDHAPGHPPYETRARFLGELAGSWFDIGFAVGRGAGDLVRWVSDVWWRSHVDTYGAAETLGALPRYEAQLEALDPGLIAYLRGVAAGAEEELAKSPHAAESTHYQKILNLNVYDSWSWRHPVTPGAGLAVGSGPACSAFASVGRDARGGSRSIAAHNRHCPLSPKCYQVSYVGRPDRGNAFWVLAPAGAGSGCQIVNARGVSIMLNAGGERHREMGANAFGVPWFPLFLHLAAACDTARVAIEVITRGNTAYRAATRRESLLRTGTWNFLVSDRTECAVVESSCDRYAIRRPGEAGENGPYVVMTNHNLCDHSYDEHNERTNLPMIAFGDEKTSPGSATRFWTLMSDLAPTGGAVDADHAMSILRGHHATDRQGRSVDPPAGQADHRHAGCTCPHGNPAESGKFGSADSKVAVCGEEVRVHWTLGRPCEWKGPWDEVLL